MGAATYVLLLFNTFLLVVSVVMLRKLLRVMRALLSLFTDDDDPWEDEIDVIDRKSNVIVLGRKAERASDLRPRNREVAISGDGSLSIENGAGTVARPAEHKNSGRA